MRIIVLSIGICAAVLISAEVILRIQNPTPVSGNCYTYDPVLHHTFKPNSTCAQFSADRQVDYNINSLGFRDREIESAKTPGTYRILMLGNSFTEGKGVRIEDAVSRQLENLLNNNQKPEKKYEVINAGIQGASPILEYLLIKKKVTQIKPDLIIINMSLIDFFDENRYMQIAKVNEKNEIIAVAGQNPDTLLHKIITIPQRLVIYRRIRDIYLTYSRLYNLPGTDIGNIDQDVFYIMRDIPDIEKDRLVNQLNQTLLQIKSLAQAQQAEVLVVLYPFGFLVNGDEWPGRSYWGFQTGKTYSTNVFESVAIFSANHDISLLNTIDNFKKTDEKPLFFPADGHLTPLGNHVLARAIADYIFNHPQYTLK
ncbi:MAG: SGNH/GDSL hydrolase family protein [Patescibacteria group bacterium]